jgi:hypothetical protein
MRKTAALQRLADLAEEKRGTGDDDWLISTFGRWSPSADDYGRNAV